MKPVYTKVWSTSSILPSRLASITAAAKQILANKVRYQAIEKTLGVPWFFVGCIHKREADCNFQSHLHNGDSLKARTHQVPAGRPLKGNPPFTWEESAVDALTMRGLNKVKIDCVEMFAYETEGYNGWGYALKHKLSPYDDAGLTQDGSHEIATGKYIADHVFDASVIDKQPGTLSLLKVLMQLDPSISFAVPVPPHDAPVPHPNPPKVPTPPAPVAKVTIWTAIGNALSAFIKRISPK